MADFDLPTSLIIGEDEDPVELADHSVLMARDTYQIPDTNSSQNVKKELEEIWKSNRSYGNFYLVENTGGLHEFIPDQDKSEFSDEEMVKVVASDITIRAKKALMKGLAPHLVLAEVRRRIPDSPEYNKVFAKLSLDLKEAMGLLGNVYIDPSMFSSCPEGVKFMATASVKPSYVLELDACRGCVYHKEGGGTRHCVLFEKRIEARLPWTNKEAMKELFRKAMTETGSTVEDVVALRGKTASTKETLRSLYLKATSPSAAPSRLSVEKEAQPPQPPSLQSHVEDTHSLEKKAVLAFKQGVAILPLAERLLSKLGSIQETVRVIKQALAQVGQVRQAQLPCPSCQTPPSSQKGKRVASFLPSGLPVIPGKPCVSCGRDHSALPTYWGLPFVAPGMRSGVAVSAGGRAVTDTTSGEEHLATAKEFAAMFSQKGEIPISTLLDPPDEG